MQAYTHFRSVFDVSPARPMDNAWAALIGEIRTWIVRKEKDPLKGFFSKAVLGRPRHRRGRASRREPLRAMD